MMRKRRFCETLGVRRKIPSEYQRFWGHCRMRTACRKRSDAMAEARRMAICYLHVARRIYRAKSVGKSRALGRRRSSSTLPESRDRDENAKVTRLFEPFRTFRICHRQGNSIHILSPFFFLQMFIYLTYRSPSCSYYHIWCRGERRDEVFEYPYHIMTFSSLSLFFPI